MSNRQRPSPSAEGHHGEMSSPAPCHELLWLKSIMLENEMKPQQIAVFVVLLAFREGDRCKLTKAEIGAVVGLGERQVATVLKQLERHVVAFIAAKRSGRSGNTYVLNAASIGSQPPVTQDNRQSISGNQFPVTKDNRKAISGQETTTGNQAPVVCGEVLPPIYKHARGTSSLRTELYPERVESSGNSSATLPLSLPVKILNGSAKGMMAHELSSKLIEVIDSPSLSARSHGLAKTCHEIKNWISDGADFDTDIVPAVRDLCDRKRGEQITSYRYFTAAVRDAATTRMALEQASNPITIEEVNAKRDRPASTYPRQRGRARSVETEILMRDILNDTPERFR